MNNLIISYEQGYHNWYVSEFYKYFHNKITQETNVKLTYLPISQFAKIFGKELNNNFGNIFNWYNLIIYNKDTEKFFIHSWYDYAPEILNYSIENNFNLVKFSCVSNLTDSIIDEYKNRIIIQPSVYCLENWDDIDYILSVNEHSYRLNKAYFNGLNYGIRELVLNKLSKNEFFNIKIKNNQSDFRQKKDYYLELSNHNFGVSLNGAANICYRDLELFGLGIINLREPFKSKTYNPIINGVHYIEFFSKDLINKILINDDVSSIIDNKVNELLDLYNSSYYGEIRKESKKWFIDNCLPENQYNILVSFLEDFNIFE
jgi:hypothetical protein